MVISSLTLNLYDILSATLLGMLLGALWYSSIAFGPAWMRSINKTPEALGNPTGPMIGSVVASLLTAIGVTALHAAIGISSAAQAISLGLLLGLLIIFPALLSDNLFCGWGRSLLLIQAGYRVLAVIVMSVAVYVV